MSHQRRQPRNAVPNLSDPGLAQMALQMMQNPEMARMMQDPRIVQTAMSMVQQQQRMAGMPPPPPPQPMMPYPQLHQQMAAMQIGQAPQFMPPPFMPMPIAAPPRKSRSRAAMQQEAAEKRKQKKAEKEQRKAAKKKASKRRGGDSDEDEEEFDIAHSTEIYNMWNRMLLSMIDKAIEARPADKFALTTGRDLIARMADSKEAELRKRPLNELYEHLLPHHELVKNHDMALFDPANEALGELSALGLHKHLATATKEQVEDLWKGIELLFLLAVQIKSANSFLLKALEASLMKAKFSAEDAAQSGEAPADGPSSFKDSLGGLLQGGGLSSGPLGAILGPMTGGAQDLDSLVAQLPADVQAQVKTIVDQVEGKGDQQQKPADEASAGANDLFGSYGMDAILALLRTNTIIPKNATKKK